MQISSRGRYALLAVFDLASHPEGALVTVAGIAGRQSIPAKFLELILFTLKQEGIVGARRGVAGGYYLTRPPGHITVGQVLRAVEVRQDPTANGNGDDPFRELWQDVDQRLSAVLDHTDFARLVRRWTEREHIPDWQI